MPTKIGNHIYLFESAKKQSKVCLISAHGRAWGGTRGGVVLGYTVPPGITLHFYTPHGYVLGDPGINFLQTGGTHAIAETIGPGKSTYDYLLTKYQGRHNKSGESYKNIQDTLDTRKRMIDALSGDDISGAERTFASTLHIISIATIRNRSSRPEAATADGGGVALDGMPMSWTIEAIRKKRPQLVEFHCSFCRSTTPGMPTIPGYATGGVIL